MKASIFTALILFFGKGDFSAQAHDRLPESDLFGIVWVDSKSHEIAGLRCLIWSEDSTHAPCEISQLVAGVPASPTSSNIQLPYVFEPIGNPILLSGVNEIELFHQKVLHSLERIASSPTFDSVDPWNHLEKAAFLTLDHPIAWALLPFAAFVDLGEIAVWEAPQAMNDKLQKKHLLRKYRELKSIPSMSDVTFEKVTSRNYKRVKFALVDASYQL